MDGILSGFWEALIAMGVPVNAYCLNGGSPLGRMDGVSHPLLLNLYEISREAETELCPPWIESSYLRTGHVRTTRLILEAFKEVPGIAESYGCGPLSLAVLSNQLDRVKYLLDNFPETLNERNLLGHTPLHLAVSEPDCLLLLLGAIPRSSEILNLLDNNFHSPLKTALYYSNREWIKSPLYESSRSVSILLEADCAVSNPNHYDIWRIPNHIMLQFASHLADRRSRLKDFAIQFNSVIEGETVALNSIGILDGQAEGVECVLAKHGHVVPTPLRTQPTLPRQYLTTDIYWKGHEIRQSYYSVYTEIDSTDYADIFWNLGFRDLHSYHPSKLVSPLAVCVTEYPSSNIIAYENWLLDHGANPLQPFPMLNPSLSCQETRVIPSEDIVPPDDVVFIQEEERVILSLLESLLIDFEREMFSVLKIQPFDSARFIEFWRDYWVPKMHDVLEDLNTDKLPEETKCNTEDLGGGLDSFQIWSDEPDHDPWKSWWADLDEIVVRG
ncbi:hypothetical protein PG987_001966 [Apiospora arundinis]